MPIYEYKCKACGHEFEVFQKMSDKPVKKCEACGKQKAERQISQTSFVLKGTGWYATDYAGHKVHGGSESEGTSSSTASEPAAKPKETKSSKEKNASA